MVFVIQKSKGPLLNPHSTRFIFGEDPPFMYDMWVFGALGASYFLVEILRTFSDQPTHKTNLEVGWQTSSWIYYYDLYVKEDHLAVNFWLKFLL